MKHNHLMPVVALAAAILTAGSVYAQTSINAAAAAEQINAANTLLRDGNVDGALEAYGRIVPAEDQQSEWIYNRAVAEYRKGNIESAAHLFTKVATADSTAVAADSRYNLGNCRYATALQLAETDRLAAIEALREAISHYRASLRIKSSNADARANIELAAELIRRLDAEQKQKEQQQQNDDQQQQLQQTQNNDDEQQDQQKSDQQKQDEQQKPDASQNSESPKDDSEQNGEPQPSDSQEPESDQQNSKDSQPAGEQRNPDEQKSSDTEQQKSSQQKSSEQQQPSGDSADRPQESQDRQQRSGDQTQPEEGPPEEQESENQPVPTGDLKATDEQNNDGKPTGSVGMADPNATNGLMTREEALKMLQAVRDRDMLRRLQQQRRERSRHVPVDRDW
ncbi:MAG: hypothetical protein R3C59_22385 [Planctomycetaceae bacterium]